ncbi:hypothetical protein QMO56_23905 [Roseomonas sp. E05]|uniref:hypothetical protein n=1 Tax=Roseomonas sp. E05 TaxID=3046310 RepID=UPI0024B8DDCC|nr:hypothetical protein [Roseomonas sp. E05]MDJ0391160.1 hypothetical protein [Roseomonas sp. E05]
MAPRDPQIAAAIQRRLRRSSIQPHYSLPVFSAEEARAEIWREIAGFYARALDWHTLPAEERAEAEHSGLAVEVGAGKTTFACAGLASEARRQAAGFIATAKARALPHRVLYTVPYHKLGQEVCARMTGLGLQVAMWRGRGAEDPNAPGQPMCRNGAAVKDALAAGDDVEAAVCGRAGGARCPFFDTCAYQRQKLATQRADVVVAAHEVMLGGMPAGIGNGFGLVVADESWWQDGIGRTQVGVETLAAGPGAHWVPRQDDPERMDEGATNDLHALRARLAAAVQASPDGYLTRAALLTARLDAKGCGMAHRLEWRRKVSGLLHPGLPEEARQDALRRCRGNAAIPALAAVWKAAEELLDGGGEATGRVELATVEGSQGRRRVLRLNTIQAVAEKVLGLPLLLLDATLPAELLRHRLPRLRVLAKVRAQAPHMQVHQVLGGFGKTSLTPNPATHPAENARRGNRIAELRDFIVLRTGCARALVITYQQLEAHFAGLPRVETAHFNAVAGRDEWRDVRHLFVIGRPMPAAGDTRRLAAALSGRPVPVALPPPVTCGATMRDGTAAPVLVHAYADPDLEAVREAIMEVELVQGIGRGRGINRTAENPLDVWVLAGDVVLPLPLDSLCSWQDVAPGPLERMAARGVILTSPRDAARAYSDLFPTVEAAKKALQRDQGARDFGDIPLWKLSIGECPRNSGFIRVTYRPSGRGQQTRTAWARLDRLPKLRAWLETVTGATLVLFEPDNPSPPPPSPPEPPLPDLQDQVSLPPAVLDLRRGGSGSGTMPLVGAWQSACLPRGGWR